MPKTITFEGQTHTFPDDATEEEIRAALSNAAPAAGAGALAGAESVSEQPAFTRDISLGSPMGPTVGEVKLPFALSDIAEALPALGGTLGALIGRHPAVAGAGSAVGEVARQGIRSAAGYVPAPGNLQEMMGLDPSSAEARVAGVAGETAMGAIPDWLSGLLAKGATPLREAGLRQYAHLLEPKGERELVKATEKLRPVQGELPMLPPLTGRGRLEKIAERKVKKAGEKVGELYNVETPSSFKPAMEELKKVGEKNVRYPAHDVPVYDDAGNIIDLETVDATFKDPKLAKAFKKHIEELQTSQTRAETYKGGPSRQDIFEARQTTDEMAKRAKGTVFDQQAKELSQEVQALKAKRTGLSKTLHADTMDPATGKSLGEEADAIFSAWKSLEKAGKQKDAGTFLQRWAVSRLISGPVGTVGGVASTQPAFWRSLSSKTMRGLATALEANDQAALGQLMRVALADYERAGQR